MGIITAVLGGFVTFVVGLVVGGLGIYVGARLVVDEGDFGTAVWTALFGSLGWAVASALVGWIPFIGGLLGLVLGLAAYLGVVNWQYSGGWGQAAAITAVAWVAVVVVRTVLAPLLGGFGAVGVPFA